MNLALQLGLAPIQQQFAALLGRPASNPYPSFVLGAEPMTPMEVGVMYGTLASGGFRARPKSVIEVIDEQGQPLSAPPFEFDQVVEGEAVAALTLALQATMAKGTGRSSRHARLGVAGKTGTSNDNRDSWFAAYDERTVSVVWVGRDDNQPMGLTGTSGALRLWDPIMQEVGIEGIAPSPNERLVEVEYDTGLLAHAGCADTVTILVTKPDTLQPKPGCGIKRPHVPTAAEELVRLESSFSDTPRLRVIAGTPCPVLLGGLHRHGPGLRRADSGATIKRREQRAQQ